MHKQTVLDHMETTADGTIQARFAKEEWGDDGTLIKREWHRTSFPPGTDVDAQMAAVNRHLVEGLKCAPVEAAEIDRVKLRTQTVWTKPVTDAYAAKREASAAAIG